jgi:hypothetical protein
VQFQYVNDKIAEAGFLKDRSQEMPVLRHPKRDFEVVFSRRSDRK